MPTIEWIIDENGENNSKVKGIKGKACHPITEFIAEDMKTALGLEIVTVGETPEFYEGAERVANTPIRNAVQQ